MREFFEWVCFGLMLGGILVTCVGIMWAKGASLFGAKSSTQTKALLVLLIGIAMTFCGYFWFNAIYRPHSPPRDAQVDSD
jgi:hypothetical protein